MRAVCIFLILVILNFNLLSNAKEELFDAPIDIINKVDCTLEEFCQKFIKDIDIEKFIKQEIENDYVIVSLDECLDVALKNNFNIKIQDKIYFSSKYEYQNSLSKFLPMLSTTSYISEYGGQILVGGVLRDRIHETALSVNMTAQHLLFEGGKQIFEAKAKKYYQKSAKHNLNFSKTKVVYLTSRYYFEMLLAKLNIEIYLKNLIERNTQLAVAKKLQKSGLGSRFDVVRSENESTQARIQLLEALNLFRLSQSRLANLMGIDVNTALMPFEDSIIEMHLIDLNFDMQALLNIAKNNREDLKAYKDIINSEKQVKNSYYTDFVPKPLVNFQEQFQGTLATSVRPNYIISGLVTWAPGENSIFGTLTKIKAQKEKIKMRTLEYENLLREIEENIINSFSTFFFNKKKVSVSKKRVDSADESRKLAMHRFNKGKGIFLDVVEAQGEITKAKINFVSTIVKYNISQIEILYYLGTIDKDIVLEKV